MTVARHAFTLRSKGQRSRLRGYQMHVDRSVYVFWLRMKLRHRITMRVAEILVTRTTVGWRTDRTGSGIMTSSMAERGVSTRHKPGSRLLSRLRCGLQTRLSCTAGLSCKPSSTSESSSNIATRRRVDSVARVDSETVSGCDRKRLRSRDRKSSSDDDVISGVGRCSSKAPPSHSASRTAFPLLTSGGFSTSCHVTSGSAESQATYDVIERRHKRRCTTRLTTVSELDAPEPEMEMVTWSRDQVTGNDVMEPLMTTSHHRRAPEIRQLQCSCCTYFCGEALMKYFILLNICVRKN